MPQGQNSYEPSNNLRVKLYERLRPFLIKQDRASGAAGYIMHWDTPDFSWDSNLLLSIWDSMGLSPVIQELFYVIETLEGEDLQVLESLKTLTDPLTCPTNLLSTIAASFGYNLSDNLTDDAKRVALIGLFQAFKAAGQRISFDLAFRLVGFEVTKITPLWKKDIYEANNDYSPVQFTTTTATTAVGPSGNIVYAGRFADVPIAPGTIRITSGSTVLRDNGEGLIIGPGNQSGTVDYESGDYTINFGVATGSAVSAEFEHITEEWPYHAARFDLEVSINPGGGPIPLIDNEFVNTIFSRIEEARPAHVLLRLLAIVIEIKDDFSPGPTDRVVCSSEVHDDRVNSMRRYFADIAPSGEDIASVQRIVGGVKTEDNILIEDVGANVCPVDQLYINAGGTEYHV